MQTLQSHVFLTMSHWSSGLTCLLPVTRDPGSNPLWETGIILLELSHYNDLQTSVDEELNIHVKLVLLRMILG